MNSICLMGRLTADPELKTTQSGLSVTSFALAVERPYVTKGQERATDFINCVAWRQTAEFITRYFRKGQRMAANGALQTRSYETRDGGKRTAYEVVIDNAYFCEAKGGSAVVDEEITPAGSGMDCADPVMQNTRSFMDVMMDEELPI